MTRKPWKAFAPKLPQRSATGVPMWKPRWASAIIGIRCASRTSWSEGQLITLQVLGEKLLIKRIDGKVYAIRDRCLHRGVPLSRKPDCYTKETITCWYHGYTYRFQTGELVNTNTRGKSSITQGNPSYFSPHDILGEEAAAASGNG